MVNLDLPSFLHFLHAVAHKKDRIPSISHMWSGMVTYPVLVTQSLVAILWAKLKFNFVYNFTSTFSLRQNWGT